MSEQKPKKSSVETANPDEEIQQTEMSERTAASGSTPQDAGLSHDGKPVQDPERAEFGDLIETSKGNNPAGWNLQMLSDIPVTLSVEVGRHAISISNLLKLSQGSVVELDRTAGEALDVMVNGCLVAHGEVVVVNDRFGIRLTDVVSPAERVKKLN